MAYLSMRFGTYKFEKPEGFQISGDSRVSEVEIPRRHGSLIVSPIVLKSRSVAIRETLVADSPAALQAKYDALRSVLEAGENKLYLYDNRYINAIKTSFGTDYERGTSGKVAHCTMQFLATDPFVYTDTTITNTAHVLATAQTQTLTLLGTAPIKPVITIRNITASSLTSVRITNGSNYFQVGPLTIGDTWVIDMKNYTCTKNGVSALGSFLGNFFSIPSATLIYTVSPSPCNFYCDVVYLNTYYDI